MPSCDGLHSTQRTSACSTTNTSSSASSVTFKGTVTSPENTHAKSATYQSTEFSPHKATRDLGGSRSISSLLRLRLLRSKVP